MYCIGGDLVPSLGRMEKMLRPIFEVPIFLRKILFFSHGLYYVCFYCLKSDEIWYITLFLTKNLDLKTKNSSLTPCFTQFVLCLTSDNNTSQNIGGMDAWAVPTSNFGWTAPQFPLSLRPWYIVQYARNIKLMCSNVCMTIGQGLQGPCGKGAQISCFVPRRRIPKQCHWLWQSC